MYGSLWLSLQGEADDTRAGATFLSLVEPPCTLTYSQPIHSLISNTCLCQMIACLTLSHDFNVETQGNEYCGKVVTGKGIACVLGGLEICLGLLTRGRSSISRWSSRENSQLVPTGQDRSGQSLLSSPPLL